MDEINIKPCPFCGGEAKLVDYGISGKYKVVQCLECGARTRLFDPEIFRGGNAVEAWNRRTGDGNDEVGS